MLVGGSDGGPVKLCKAVLLVISPYEIGAASLTKMRLLIT